MRFFRPVMALIATGTAAVTIGISGVPAAHADQIRTKEWWLRRLGVTLAWPASQGAGVTVAVLSDGVQASHADLAGAITAAPAPPGAPQASGQFFGETGTPIASLIAGRGHGSVGTSGIFGVAPEAKILSVPVTLPAGDPQLNQSGNAAAIPAAIADGIRYAVKHGATVIDLPIDPGQPNSSGTSGASAAAGGSRAEQSAVSYALAHDVVLVAPAGDDGTSSDARNYPAAYRGVIAVGAFNSALTKAPWSSHQSYVTVTAAGAGVLAAANSGGYVTMNSTSAASAIVAGVAALIRARYPNLSVGQVRTAITTSTSFRRRGGQTGGSGFGVLSADKAMAAAAVLATPRSSRAGAGAQPLLPPGAIPPASSSEGLGSQVRRAGELSGAVFAALLLLIIAYAATGRRRRRSVRSAVVTAQWAHRQGQSRYPQVAAADADRMLEAFATPLPEPDRTGLTSAANPGSTARSGPATRAVSKRPAVSGTPPWEPASAPNSELPWTAAPGEHPVGGSPAPAALPGGHTDWQGQDSWPGGPSGHSMSPSAGQPDPNHPRQADWRQVESQATWDSPGASPGAARGGQPERNAPHRDGGGWDGGRWNPAPAIGPVIEGSVLSSESAARGRASATSYPGQSSQPNQYSQYTERDRHRQSDWRGRHSWTENQAGSGQQAAPADFAARQPEQDWPGAGRPDEPRTAPSGLPVRTPRPAASSRAPMSPSGSLWERAESEPGTYQGPGGYQIAGQDTGGRPIYVWNPTDRSTSPGYPPPSELSGGPGD